MTTMFSMPVKVINIEQLTPLIKAFTFERTDGSAFSPFSAGSHVVVSMGKGSDSHKNPYSRAVCIFDVRSALDYDANPIIRTLSTHAVVIGSLIFVN